MAKGRPNKGIFIVVMRIWTKDGEQRPDFVIRIKNSLEEVSIDECHETLYEFLGEDIKNIGMYQLDTRKIVDCGNSRSPLQRLAGELAREIKRKQFFIWDMVRKGELEYSPPSPNQIFDILKEMREGE